MIGLAFLDFGGPQSPEELQPFLSNLLTDVLPGPLMLKSLVAPTIARMRAGKVGPDYEAIGWSPLVKTHRLQAAAILEALGSDAPTVHSSGMMFTAPTMDDCVAELLAGGATKIIALPFFPHYSIATTNTAFEFFYEALCAAGKPDLPVHWIPGFFDHDGYIQALAETIQAGVDGTPGDPGDPVHIVFSPHGLPVSFVTAGDPYPDQIRESVRRVLKHLNWEGPAHVAWQSRVGPVQWLTPSTPDVLETLAREGVKRVCMVPISFAADHIETLHEIDIEYRELANEAGITHFHRAPVLGQNPAFIETMASLVREAQANMSRYRCARCLLPKPDSHRRRGSCVNCKFTQPKYMREGRAP